MSNKSVHYWSDPLQRGEPIETKLLYEITGAKTIAAHDANAALIAVDAISAQSVIDNFLGTTNEFLVAAFASTPMGTDAVAFIINMGGQVDKLESITYIERSGTGLSTVYETTLWGSTTAMGTTLASGIQQGANGNVAVRIVHTGLDSLTAGQIELVIKWRSK